MVKMKLMKIFLRTQIFADELR